MINGMNEEKIIGLKKKIDLNVFKHLSKKKQFVHCVLLTTVEINRLMSYKLDFEWFYLGNASFTFRLNSSFIKQNCFQVQNLKKIKKEKTKKNSSKIH